MSLIISCKYHEHILYLSRANLPLQRRDSHLPGKGNSSFWEGKGSPSALIHRDIRPFWQRLGSQPSLTFLQMGIQKLSWCMGILPF